MSATSVAGYITALPDDVARRHGAGQAHPSPKLDLAVISSNPNKWARANTGNQMALRVGVHRGR